MNLRTIIQLIKENKFYKSMAWRRKRKQILQRDNYECQRCKSNGLFSKGECVHHKEHLKDNPARAFDDENLTTLCNECHNLEHPEKFEKMNSSNEVSDLQKGKRCKARFTNIERW